MMAQLMTYFHDLASLHSVEGITQLLEQGGILALAGILFAETGLLVGFFLPGDSLLVTAGIFASTLLPGRSAPIFSLWVLLPVALAAAVIGDQLGYWLGRKSGPLIFQREDSLLFKKKHLVSAHQFYERHGSRALVFARFVPIFRTFVPFTAGIARMPYRRFLTVSFLGGLFWTASLILVGYFLGKTPLADQLHKVILVIVFVSILPIVIGAVRQALRKPKKSLT